MNDNQQIMEEQGIGITNILWSLLEQWRGMLLVGLIFAILLAGAKHIVNVRAAKYQASEAGQDEEAAEALYQEQGELVSAMMSYKDWQDKKYYYENSPLMLIDGAKEERYILRFYFTSDHPEDTDFETIEGAYQLMVYDEKFADSVSVIFDPGIDKIYMKELFMINSVVSREADQEVELGRGLSVAVILPPRTEGEYDFELIEETLTNYMNEKKESLEKTLGDFDVKVMVSGYTVVRYAGRTTSQLSAFNSARAAGDEFRKQYNELNAGDKRIVDKIAAKGTVNTWIRANRAPKVTETEKKKESAAGTTYKFRFPKKFFALGFVIGMFIFAVLLFFRMVFSRKLRDEGEVGQVTGLRSFGGVYRYPYTSGWDRFLHSRKVYEMRHKSAAKPGAEAGKITRNVAARAQHMNASNVCMVVLGQSSDWVDSILKKQSEIFEKEGLTSNVAYAENGIASIDESTYAGMGTALLVTLSETTTPAMVAEILTRLKEYQVPVIGTEFMEVPAN